MRRKAMESWPLFCGIVGLLTAPIHSTKPLHTTDQKMAAVKPDTNEVLQRAIQYISDEAARVPEDSGSNESLRKILSDSEAGGGGKDAFPGRNLADDAIEDSGNGGSQMDSAVVKRRWGDASLQLWGKRNFEGMRGVGRSGNGSVQDVQGFRLHKAGDEGRQLLEEVGDMDEQSDQSHDSFSLHDSNKDIPCPLGGTQQRPGSKSDEVNKRKWGDNSMTVWGKRKAYEKRKWGDNSITTWGKREDGSLEQPVKRKWGDNSMTVWGKRNSDDKRKWGDNSLTAWGKRQFDDKRKWGDNSMSIWGKRLSDEKRKWGDNSMSIWGKRQADDKRKWGDNSMSIWGKRQADDKRKWGDNSMSIWEKRQADDKRKWGDNSMSIWGKRQADDKRKWGDNSMSIWGKRQADDKRKWGDNSMTVWGKRQADDKRKWGDNSMSIWGKREDDADQDQLAKRKWGDSSMTVWGKKRTNTAVGPAYDQSKAALHAWLQRLSEDKMQPFRPGHEESLAGRNRAAAALTGNILFAKAPVADAHQTTEDTSIPSSTIDRLNSQVQTGQLRPPPLGKYSNRKSIAKRSVLGTSDVLNSWPKRFRKQGWGFWGAYVNPYGGPKRNWETNTMKVWGKRRDEDDEKEAEEYTDWATTSAARDEGIWKRVWTSDNSIRIWGR